MPSPILDPRQLEALMDLGPEAGPALIQELIGIYASDTPGRIATLRRLVEEDRMEDASVEAHNLKGSLASLGLQAFAAMARIAERETKDGHREETLLQVALMPQAFQEGLEALRTAFPG